MGICVRCLYYRRKLPMSQILAQIIGTNDANVSNVLVKIVEDERQQESNEAEIIFNKNQVKEDLWDRKPIMTDFCGISEAEDKFFICGIKNDGLKCSDFKEGKPVRNKCTNCVYRIVPDGKKNDLESEKTFSDMALMDTAVGLKSSTPDNLLSKHREGVASRKAFEVNGVYTSNGILSMVPNYFDYCRKFSDEYEYVICAVRNLHNTCPFFESIKEESRQQLPAQETSSFVKATESITSKCCQEIASPAKSISERIKPEEEAFLKGYCSYMEWMLDVKLGYKAISLAKIHIHKILSKNNNAAIEWISSAINYYSEIQNLGKAEQNYNRENFQPGIVEMLRNHKEIPLFIELLRLYDEVNEPIAQGNPPLTRKTAKSFVDFIVFLYEVVRGQVISKEIADSLLRAVSDNYSLFPDDLRMSIASSPKDLSELKVVWPTLLQSQKYNYINILAQQLNYLDLFIQKILTKQQFVGYAPTNVAREISPNWSISNSLPSQSQESVLGTQADKMFATADKNDEEINRIIAEIEEAEKNGDSGKAATLNVKLQDKIQKRAAYLQMMSNIMTMNHETTMSIYRNFR